MDVRDNAAAAVAALPVNAAFDRVLVDVPCSGTGVLAKRADMRWRRQLSDLVELTCLQVCAIRVHLTCVKTAALLRHSKACNILCAQHDSDFVKCRTICLTLHHRW